MKVIVFVKFLEVCSIVLWFFIVGVWLKIDVICGVLLKMLLLMELSSVVVLVLVKDNVYLLLVFVRLVMLVMVMWLLFFLLWLVVKVMMIGVVLVVLVMVSRLVVELVELRD